jgi:hypothetical protein
MWGGGGNGSNTLRNGSAAKQSASCNKVKRKALVILFVLVYKAPKPSANAISLGMLIPRIISVIVALLLTALYTASKPDMRCHVAPGRTFHLEVANEIRRTPDAGINPVS